MIIKSEVWTFQIVVIFLPWLYAWGGCTTICCRFHTLWPDGCTLYIALPRYHHYADISESIELLKYLYILSSVSIIRSIPSVIFHAIYGALYNQLTHFSYDDCEDTCTLSYYHQQIRSMTQLPLFRVKSWINWMCCLSFYILLCSYSYLYCIGISMLDVVWVFWSIWLIWPLQCLLQ